MTRRVRGQSQAHERPDAEVAPLVQKAMQGRDDVVAYQAVAWHPAAGGPPEPARSEVFPPAPRQSFGKRFLGGFVGFVAVITDPFDWLGNWVNLIRIRSRKTKIKEKRLKGGWSSLAGGLMARHFIVGHRVLVAGRRTLSLVYVGPHDSETAWSAPLEQLTGIEVAEWDVPEDHKATLRCHFTDGSWADLVATGRGWRQFLSHLPSHPPSV